MDAADATLLTGSTDGIGLELARLWTARGEAPLLHGRRAYERLDVSLFVPERYVRADLADPSGPDDIARRLDELGVEALHRMVLNAATGWFGRAEDQEPDGVRALLEVDLLANMRLCHLLAPRLERGRGRIVFVSSVVASLPAPRFAVYAAAKAAAEGFFRSLRIELAGAVEVQVLRPGAVRTRMHAKSGADPDAIGWDRFPSAASVARRLDACIAGPPRWRTIGAANRLLRGAGRHAARVVDHLARERVR